MRKIIRNVVMSFSLVIALASCIKQENNKVEDDIIGPKSYQLESDLLTPELLWNIGRISDIQLSPNASEILFGVTWYDLDKNKGNRELYIMNTDGSQRHQITHTQVSEYDARWTPEGKITFISTESGTPQVWIMDKNGKNRKQLTRVKNGVNGYKFSTDMSLLVYATDVPRQRIKEELFEGLDKTSGRLMNDLMYRHWDSWVDAYSHLFFASFDGQQVSEGIDIMEGEPWESPVRPFGGMEQVTISPDSKTIVYTCRKKQGKEYALSTNTDLYAYSLATGQTTNLTSGMMGYDMEPVFSPDGKYLAWWSMERDGYEADLQRLFLLNLTTGEKIYASKDFDGDVSQIAWSKTGDMIYFISNHQATYQIYSYSLADGKIRQITDGMHDFKTVVDGGNKLYGIRMTIQQPDEIFSIDPSNGEITEISFINKDLFSQITLGRVKERWTKTTDGKMMKSWVIFPPHFDSLKSYPTLLFCEGGPQNATSQFWSYRWNFQLMAAHGYIIVAPNRRGVPGFGQEWKEQVSGDYGGQNMKDYFSAIDDIASEPWSDENHLGAVGASYGAFSVYWLAGHHNKRFKAFIAHDGMFNLESQYLETEEMWFVNWDLGGPYWEKDNAIAQRSYANSPHHFVDKWDTPILIIHSEKDYRIVASQGMSAFNAAVLRGIPAEFLYFPDENHWVLQPQNSVLWQRVFFDWLDQWLKLKYQ